MGRFCGFLLQKRCLILHAYRYMQKNVNNYCQYPIFWIECSTTVCRGENALKWGENTVFQPKAAGWHCAQKLCCRIGKYAKIFAP